jgi:NADH-quinone oxidoreductase subunit J
MTEPSGGERWHQLLAGVLVLILVGAFTAVLLQGNVTGSEVAGVIDTSPARLGLHLFEAYVLPFEVTGVLLLTAIIGVAVFSKRTKKQPEEGS